MASSRGGRRIVDALDDIAKELRTANRLQALTLGVTALEHDSKTPTEASRARVERRNALRSEVRQALDLEEES